MTILVTGGTGFLGEEFLKFACKKYKIFATYRTRPGIKLKNVTWIKLDLVEKKSFGKLLPELRSKIDVVIHIGGASPNRAYADGNFRATTEGTKNLIAWSKKMGIRKFIFISSIVVNFPFNGPYADSKRVAEKYVINSGLAYTIFQPETIIGNGAKDFSRVAKILQQRKFMPIVGNGNNLTQPIASIDLIKMIDFSVNHSNIDGKIYPAVGPEAILLKSLFRKIAGLKKNKIILIPVPIFLCRFIAKLAGKLNPKWGLNEERINFFTHSRSYPLDHMKDFKMEMTHVDEALEVPIQQEFFCT